jgi:hypothetical protein
LVGFNDAHIGVGSAINMPLFNRIRVNILFFDIETIRLVVIYQKPTMKIGGIRVFYAQNP